MKKKDETIEVLGRIYDYTLEEIMGDRFGQYAKDIIPIQEAIETRKKQAEMQQQAYLQNPTLLLSRRASTTSLDEYLKNPNLEYDSYSGAMLTQQVSQQAQALAKELTEYGLGKPIDAYTNTFLKRNLVRYHRYSQDDN